MLSGRRSATSSAVALAAILATALSGPAAFAASQDPTPRQEITATARAGAETVRLAPAQRAELLRDAAETSSATATSLRLGSGEKLVPKDVIKDADGTVHTRYERTYHGLPVIGGDLVVHQRGTSQSTTKGSSDRIAVATTVASVPASKARKSALDVAKAEHTKEVAAEKAPRLVVWAAGDGKPRLAWQSVVTGVQSEGTPSRLHVLTDASTGEELQSVEQIHTGTGQSQYSGRVQVGTVQNGALYELTDPQRGDHHTEDLLNGGGGTGALFTDDDNLWGDGTAASRQTAAVDAAFGQRETWDFYHDRFDRNGIADDGAGAVSRVHAGVGYANAYWDSECFCMTYGDGADSAHPLTQLDIAAHEMTHGVTSETAGLIYEGESGGLNEATSDIMATAVEFYAANAADRPDYMLGELVDIKGTGEPLRYMDEPSKDASDRGVSEDYWTTSTKDLDVHFSSGVGNHFFYLLAEGSGKKKINGVSYDSPTFDGKRVTGIGLQRATDVWYRALTRYMTSTTDYAGARVATLQAAADLFGKSGEAYEAVGNAWAAVNVGPRFVKHIAAVAPSTRNMATGVPVSRQVQAITSRRGALTYSASKLPTGLKINSATGLISGAPTAAGTFATVIKIRTSMGDTLRLRWPVTVLQNGGDHFVNPDRYDIPAWETVEVPITVTGRQGNAPADLKVTVDLHKFWIGGQVIKLIAPDGTTFLVKDWSWDTGDQLQATYTVDASSTGANGTWKLWIQDNTPSWPGNDALPGYLDSWRLDF
ncbi:M4 family metallopeptidase [Actinacidiphila glaucinigra]|uniref:M4 family metallopeptidase n=1 Tax=Actinacidiphila glaucinigra TaxID=235986 RepID=UPI0035D5EB1A